MTWKLTAFAKTRLPLVGVNWRDLSDEEYAAALAMHPGMDEQGYFEHVEEEAPVSRRSHTAEEPPAAPPAEEETK